VLLLKTIRELANLLQTFEAYANKQIRAWGLTQGQFDVIATLGNQQPMTCKQLAAKTLMVKGNLTVIINALSKKGLVARVINPQDARSWLIGLTPSGQQFFAEIFPQHLAELTLLAQEVGEPQLKNLYQELCEFRQQLQLATSSKN
jgi:DNA-binding MarR family transcriptional regulator